MSEIPIHWSDEAQLIGYGESDSTGAWVKFIVRPEDLIHFRGLKSTIFYMTLVELNNDGKPVEKVSANVPEKLYGKQASALYAAGFFLAPAVLVQIGADQEFRAWLKEQPCCADGPHEGDVVAAHVRRIANGAGTALKPDYSAIPLCDRHHHLQHQHGESKIGGKEWFDKQRAKYLQKWASRTLAAVFGQESMGYVDPKDLRIWAREFDVEQWLPREYRDGA
jgi:hypothetical protein